MEEKVIRFWWLLTATILLLLAGFWSFVLFGIPGIVLLVAGMLLDRCVKYLLMLASNVN